MIITHIIGDIAEVRLRQIMRRQNALVVDLAACMRIKPSDRVHHDMSADRPPSEIRYWLHDAQLSAWIIVTKWYVRRLQHRANRLRSNLQRSQDKPASTWRFRHMEYELIDVNALADDAKKCLVKCAAARKRWQSMLVKLRPEDPVATDQAPQQELDPINAWAMRLR